MYNFTKRNRAHQKIHLQLHNEKEYYLYSPSLTVLQKIFSFKQSNAKHQVNCFLLQYETKIDSYNFSNGNIIFPF
jgi:hypothetical protein